MADTLTLQIDHYKKIVLKKTSGKPHSKKCLLLLGLMTRELGIIAGALLDRNSSTLEGGLNHLLFCLYALAALLKIRLHPLGDLNPEDFHN